MSAARDLFEIVASLGAGGSSGGIVGEPGVLFARFANAPGLDFFKSERYGAAEQIAFNGAIDNAPGGSTPGVDVLAEGAHFERQGRARKARQTLRSARAGNDA